MWGLVLRRKHVQVFGTFVQIVPGDEGRSTLEHLDFYLLALRHLAGRKPLQTLFPIDDHVDVGAVRCATHLAARMQCNEFLYSVRGGSR